MRTLDILDLAYRVTQNEPKAVQMWEQARGELHGFANHLERSNSGLTASQLRLALALAQLSCPKLYNITTECIQCSATGSMNHKEAFLDSPTMGVNNEQWRMVPVEIKDRVVSYKHDSIMKVPVCPHCVINGEPQSN